MKPTMEPDPRPPYPVLSDTQMWIEIAYLDPGSDFKSILLTTEKRPKKSARILPWGWIFIAFLTVLVSVVLLWPLR